MRQISLDELVEKVEEIPVFPETVIRIMKLIEDPETGAKDVELEIIKDQGLTAKILKLANSSYYGVTRNIKTVSQATVLLGFQAIKSMILATSVGKVFDKPLPGYALGKEALWRQSQICAITTRVIAKEQSSQKRMPLIRQVCSGTSVKLFWITTWVNSMKTSLKKSTDQTNHFFRWKRTC